MNPIASAAVGRQLLTSMGLTAQAAGVNPFKQTSQSPRIHDPAAKSPDYDTLAEKVAQGVRDGLALADARKRTMTAPDAADKGKDKADKQGSVKQLTSWLQRDKDSKDKPDPTKPAAAPARPSAGVTDLPVIGYLSKFFGGLIARVSGVLGPLGMLSTALSSASSGFGPFLSSVKVLGTLVGAMLAPFFMVLGAAVLTVADYFASAILPVLGKYYAAVLQGAADIAKGAKEMADELPLVAEGLGGFVDDLGELFQSIYDKGQPLVSWLGEQLGSGYRFAEEKKTETSPHSQGMQGNMIQRFYNSMFDWGSKNLLGGEGYQTYKEQEGGSHKRGQELDKKVEANKQKQREEIEKQGGAVLPGMSPAEAAEARKRAEGQGSELRAPSGGAPPLFSPQFAPPVGGPGTPPADARKRGESEGGELRMPPGGVPQLFAPQFAPPNGDGPEPRTPLPGQTPAPKLPQDVVGEATRRKQEMPNTGAPPGQPGKPGAPGAAGGSFLGNLKLMMQEFRSQTARPSQTSSLTGVVSAMQAAALNGSPLDKKMADLTQKILDKMEESVNGILAVERKISPATTN